MTCELCGKSPMNVMTYQLPTITKVDACTPCIRDLDAFVRRAQQTHVDTILAEITRRIAARGEAR